MRFKLDRKWPNDFHIKSPCSAMLVNRLNAITPERACLYLANLSKNSVQDSVLVCTLFVGWPNNGDY